MSAAKRVLVVQPSLEPSGGENAVAVWMIQALAESHDVSVLTWQPIDLDAVNEYYGTTIKAGDITPYEVPSAIRRPIDLLPTPSTLLKASFVLRYAKQIADQFDVVISPHNDTDLGSRCIQYVPHPARLRRKSALANSALTAKIVRRFSGASRTIRVLYPPVSSEMPDVPWEWREDGFVCIGRISPRKELERVIDVIAAVRASVPSAHLHIIGSRGPAWYVRRIRRLAEQHPWLELHEDVTRTQLFRLVAMHRYAIHGTREEHGIAPAEAVSGGCVVFVPSAGGQVDIVGPEARLLMDDTHDAVAKIVRVMQSPADQEQLRAYLKSRLPIFSRERFVETVRGMVAELPRRMARDRKADALRSA